MNLEGLVSRLERLKVSGFGGCPLVTDAGTAITGMDSYRGYYEQLQLTLHEPDWPNGPEPSTVDGVLTEARELLAGRPYFGYKGGTYTALPYTTVWVSRCGEANSIAALHILTPEHSTLPVIVVTADISDYA